MTSVFAFLSKNLFLPFLHRVEEAAGDQSWPQIPQWVYLQHKSSLLIFKFLSMSRTGLFSWAGSHSFKLVIPLKSELAVELLEKGRVRFWLQAEKISANGKVEYVFNDNVVSQGEVSKQQTN